MRTAVARPHWSYSSVSQYLRCPLQYYFERLLKLPRATTTDAQVLGSAVHSALADYHRGLQSGQRSSTQQVRRAYLAAWGELAGRGKVVGPGGTTLDDARDLGVALLDLYLAEPPPEGIVAVERPLLTPIANSRGEYLEDPILVIPDLIARDGHGALKVREIKTSGRSFSGSEVATSLQPTFYSAAIHEATAEGPAVEFTVLVKTRTPKLQAIEVYRTTADFGRLGDLIEGVARAIEAGIFYPQESPMNCSGCAYFRECRGWSGPGSPDPGDRAGVRVGEAAPC